MLRPIQHFGLIGLAGRVCCLGIATLSSLALAACAPEDADPSKSLLSAPTSIPTPIDAPTTPPLDRAVALVLDVTSSTRAEYLTGAEVLLADAVDNWSQPGRGGVDLVVTLINSYSYDPVNQVVAARLDGLPPVPTLRAAKVRPPQPDLLTCQKNAFNRVKCEEALVSDYNAALREALEDEQAARSDHDGAVSAYETLVQQRSAEAKKISENLRTLKLETDNTASDIWGGFLRAAEFLSASSAVHKRLIVQSDLEATGPQQSGVLDLTGIDVVVIFWDCRESQSCASRKDAATARFLASGASSVAFFDPASSRLLSNVLGGSK